MSSYFRKKEKTMDSTEKEGKDNSCYFSGYMWAFLIFLMFLVCIPLILAILFRGALGHFMKFENNSSEDWWDDKSSDEWWKLIGKHIAQ